MSNASFEVPVPQNEPITPYAPGTAPRVALEAELERMAGEVTDIR